MKRKNISIKAHSNTKAFYCFYFIIDQNTLNRHDGLAHANLDELRESSAWRLDGDLANVRSCLELELNKVLLVGDRFSSQVHSGVI
jgi:hypothetical protein